MDNLITLITGSVSGIVAAYLANIWLKIRLQESIKHHYATQLEEIKSTIKKENDIQNELFKRNEDKKQKIELVAEILAVWMAVPPGEDMAKEHRTRMNTLSFQAAIWLPEKLAKELAKRLQGMPTALIHSELLILARHELNAEDGLTISDITHWPHTLEKQNRPYRLIKLKNRDMA
ncbi:MAG: hypothetical protein IPQ12_09870 [Polaromonas sp.]|jgi:formiminotetrahydrofolate cyclodeaminase|nr:hypothetical protein [Polaromonas sp.]MBP8873053.1 hypothetical protein [Polaromonas sp.]MBP9830515.1 hypothetical protein [Polaromonas sp.]